MYQKRLSLTTADAMCGGAQDPRLPKLLEALRASGRKLFLATNSLWDYTHVVMNFLLAGRTGSQRNMDWLEYFDAVITGMHQLCQPSHLPAPIMIAQLTSDLHNLDVICILIDCHKSEMNGHVMICAVSTAIVRHMSF